ncbi:neprilysin-4-like isoform X2 [Ischnura elegans]|uniref:neprilysin-4-like isoform X2 n=1 Tax=Ischnura elegans TaxID=197161 RepID=UPI001ED8837C|nr:neprilysin-4-like isoform X2 [Ischnura elegans]
MILNRLGEPERCPSCKVTLENRECNMANRRGENENCLPKSFCQRINHHLVLPLLLLPVVLLLLGLARLIARPEHESLLYKSSVEALNGQHNLEEFEDRDLISGIKTSFVPLLANTVPLNVLPLSHRRRRRRRQIRDVMHGLHDKGNMSTYDTIEWAAVKPPYKDQGETTTNGQEQGDEGGPGNYEDEEGDTSFETSSQLFKEEKSDWEDFWYGRNDERSIRQAQAQMMLTLMNQSVDPCEDFYEYACGRWPEVHPIPRNRAGSDTFEILRSNIDAVVRSLLENETVEDETVEEHGKEDNLNVKSKLSDIMSAREVTSHEESDSSTFPVKQQKKTPPLPPSARHLEMKRNNERALLAETTTEKGSAVHRTEKNEIILDPLLILSDLYKTATSSEEVKDIVIDDFLSNEEGVVNLEKINQTVLEEEDVTMVNPMNKSVKGRVKKSTHLLTVEDVPDLLAHSHESQLSNKGFTLPSTSDQSSSRKMLTLSLVNSSESEISMQNGDLSEVKNKSIVNRSVMEINDTLRDKLKVGNLLPNNSGMNSIEVIFPHKNQSIEELKLEAKDSQDSASVSSIKGTDRIRIKLKSPPFTVVDVTQKINNSSNHQITSEKYEKEEKFEDENVRHVDESIGKNKQPSRPNDAIKKARHLYQSCMNIDIIEKRSEKPLVKLLEELGGGWPEQNKISNSFEWTSLAAKLRLFNNNILIAEWIGPDIRNSSEYVIQLDEAGLGLPTRDYFLSTSNTEAVKAYRQFIVTLAQLLGSTAEDAETLAEQLVNFEIHLALITATHEEKKSLSELYHKMTVDELCEAVPGINWRQYLGTILESTHRNFDMTTLNSTTVVVFGLRYFKDLVGLIEKYPPRTVQSYMLWRFASHRAGNLDKRFLAAIAQLRRTLTGREEEPPRWETCVAHTTAALGHAVGSLFVKRYFDEQSKSDTLRMTSEIRSSFRQSLLDPEGATASWMDEETRSLAVDKADAMSLRVGYPDSILDPDLLDLRYKDLKIDREQYFENTLAVLKYLTWREHSFLGMEVDKSQWSASPTEVNAFYSRNKNQILLPAGILQPPFYHRHFPRSLNYGGVGVVIGHEMTHGFDIRGRLFDRNGNLQRWWQPPAIDAFQKRAMCLVDQYSRYYVNEVSMQIDGMRTQGENIADNGGIKQAFKAYEDWLKRHGDGQTDGIEESLPGLDASPRQLFFLNFAQVWCGALRPEAMRNKLKTSIHSLGKFRVIGALSNSEDFASAFSCPEGSPMNPQVKCSVW